MEQWEKDLTQMLETVAVGVEQFCEDLAEALETVADEVVETFDIFVEHLEDGMLTEIDRCLQDLSELILEEDRSLEVREEGREPIFWQDLAEEEQEEELESTFESQLISARNPACVGCSNYHGQSYGGNFLVCAMHPYGWDDENCPDWEKNS